MPNRKIIKVSPDQGRKLIVKEPAGAEISMIIDGQSEGAKYLSENITKIKPGVTLKPVHSHKDIEEIIYVIQGCGEVWVEGQSCKIKKGDSVFFPANSIHTTKNTGTGELSLLCLFSSPHFRKEGMYRTHEGAEFE